jgi:hypothetical protein
MSITHGKCHAYNYVIKLKHFMDDMACSYMLYVLDFNYEKCYFRYICAKCWYVGTFRHVQNVEASPSLCKQIGYTLVI